MVQNDQLRAIQKAKNSVNIVTNLNPYFPNIFLANQLLEVLDRNEIKLFYQLEYPGHFLSLLRVQRVQELCNGQRPDSSR